MSWFLLGASVLFILVAALLIANGSCSQSRGLSASSPICVGGELSVQSWLAIVGVEFTILGIIIVPRLQSVLISKILTWRLTHQGMPLARLLNSQTTSPSWTKLHLGSKSTLFIRLCIFCAIIIVSILYKFSFVLVGREDTMTLKDAKAPINIGCSSTGCNGVSMNFLDALNTSNSSSSFNITLSPTTSSAPKHYYQVFGPSQDNVAQELGGDLYLCTPTYYSRNKVTPNGSDWVPPLLTPYSNIDGLRFTNPFDHSILDIFSKNGTPELLSGTFGILNQDSEYRSMLTASVEVRLGFASWRVNNTLTPTSYLQDPIDIACVSEPFNLTAWTLDPSSQFPLGVLGGLGWDTVNDLPLQTVALNVILATLKHTDAKVRLDEIYTSMLNSDASIPILPQCSQTKESPATANQWVASGTVRSYGTGMTQLGVVLQALVIILCICPLTILFVPVLPLVSEWPAQWLGLVYGLTQAKSRKLLKARVLGERQRKTVFGDERRRAKRDGYGLVVVAGMWLRGVRIDFEP
ncbi:hypothetical protein N431DRAFT_468386 [Stipitochalara longipes BDJ]|nr:hypothetical protein N431DRAFT_468386 [Stipitochalara longipes BDJ]